jgi:hypothetical protein
MKKVIKKLDLNKETVSFLNNQHLPGNGNDPKLIAMMGGDSTPYISKTRGTIYHCPSYPFACTVPV